VANARGEKHGEKRVQWARSIRGGVCTAAKGTGRWSSVIENRMQ